MSNSDAHLLSWHESKAWFADAIAFTASQTGFSQRLIEKDYFCSVALHALSPAFAEGLIFKGGTSLSKVHAGFYRLSEDLDFVISVDPAASRSVRRAKIELIRELFKLIPDQYPCLAVQQDLKANNVNRHYGGRLSYESCIATETGQLTVEISLRELVIEPHETASARTLLLDPASGDAACTMVAVSVLGIRETYSEKIRAALTRREPRIRDFFDVAFALRERLFDPSDPVLHSLVAKKVAIPGNEPVSLSSEKKAILARQLEVGLRSVLKPLDFSVFDLDAAYQAVIDLAFRCGLVF